LIGDHRLLIAIDQHALLIGNQDAIASPSRAMPNVGAIIRTARHIAP
jgi:hypothetical protein